MIKGTLIIITIALIGLIILSGCTIDKTGETGKVYIPEEGVECTTIEKFLGGFGPAQYFLSDCNNGLEYDSLESYKTKAIG